MQDKGKRRYSKNGLEALRVLKSTSADLVMLDVHMDTLDGITTLRHIKSNYLTAHVPVMGMAIQFLDLSQKDILEMSDYIKALVAADIFEE